MIDLIINFLATYLIWIFLPVSVWLIFHRDKVSIYRTLGAAILATLVSNLIKNFYYLPRPFISSGQLPLIDFRLDGSMPSGHTAFSFAFSFALFSRDRRLGLIMIAVSTLIAFGRIAGGGHSPPDVFVGFFIALVSALTFCHSW